MIPQRFFDMRHRPGVILAAVLFVAGAALALVLRYTAPNGSPAHRPLPWSTSALASLRAAADAGDEAALRSLVDALQDSTSPHVRSLVADMLRSARPEVRAAGCAWVGRHRSADLAGTMLFPRLSDADWRVRAAAFDAMRRVAGDMPNAPRSPAPLRDTPVDQREPLVFAWINSWRSAGDALPALADHCELYAASGGHWLTGTRLAQACLACHAPPDEYATADFAACATCHADAHREWSPSAHARSTLHLNLLRVDERTKQVVRYDVGPREGLVCTSCHLPADAQDATAPVPAGTEALRPAHRFKPNAAASCATCHAETQAEWDAWRSNPRPVASRWLPGEFTWDDGPEARTCVSCHMSPRPAPAGGWSHGFAARRDPVLMRGGLSAHLQPPTAGRGPQLVLTNLAGHRYPSGTGRRALRIDVSYDTQDDSAKQLLTRLSDSTVPTSQPVQPALRPGEQRRLDVAAPAGATRVTCEVTFERNHYEPGGYELPLHTVSERVTAPVGHR